MSGKFVALEGIDASGKSTVLSALYDHYYNLNSDKVIKTREPGGDRLGDDLRKILLSGTEQYDSRIELLFFYAARISHLQQLIIPNLKAGKLVLSDRYNGSSLAYQGGGRELGVDRVQVLDDWCDIQQPDLVLLIDVEPELSFQRIQAREQDVRDEVLPSASSLSFMNKVRASYLQLAKDNDHWKIIDGALSKNEIFEIAKSFIDAL